MGTRWIELKKHCLDIVKNQLIPVLHESLDNRKQGPEYQKIIFQWHSQLKRRMDFGTLQNWETVLFESDKHTSIENIIINSGTNYQKMMKKTILILKKRQVLPSIVTLGGLPPEFKTHFVDLFLMQFGEILQNLEYLFVF